MSGAATAGGVGTSPQAGVSAGGTATEEPGAAGSAGLAGGVAGSGGGGGAPNGGAPAGLAEGAQVARALGTMPGAPNGYWEYLPKGYGDGTVRPLLVFWHGGGEKGSGSADDLERIKAHGPPKLIAAGEWPAERPFIVLSPQHNETMCRMAGDVHQAFLDYAVKAYAVDPARVYQTGLSCGALGTADLLARHGPSQLAAAVLIAGDVTPAWDAQGCALVSSMSLWALHGSVDSTVLPAGDDASLPKLMTCPEPHHAVKYTSYPGVDHDSWTRTYDLSAGNDIYAWLLTQTK